MLLLLGPLQLGLELQQEVTSVCVKAGLLVLVKLVLQTKQLEEFQLGDPRQS